MRIANIMDNDTVDCDGGIAVSLWVAGCPHKCKGCHNAEFWADDSGTEENVKYISNLICSLINKNGINRKFSILGGEPMYEKNVKDVAEVVKAVVEEYPDIKILLWSGYTLEELKSRNDENIEYILSKVYLLVDGRYDESKRDITLPLMGSSNQRILYRGKDF